ncbi:class C beta-lactamase-related serine hydrolase [Erythrobacteraceae bacterium CFH 75059]|uniref:serine hydrolase domain-containing protein n=1 Tax=Qipengyuania thermophila TaxID=2509361 RepID=UPI00101FDB81|nr:serine hydrolase [Qipengyuania thermophila]TCD06735.1 class C beta-lactamase-related serine hydrolase [Erythrobacteraceae bacterium CFH 75059]
MRLPPAPTRRALIALALLLPAAAGCADPAPEASGLGEEALAAVSADPGAPVRQVARAVDALFTDPAVGETRAVILMHNGTVAAERYGPGYGPDTRFVSWSMAKTVTAVVIGMLVADGRLDLDQPTPVPRWNRPGDPRREITLRHLLQMRSGLRHTESGEPSYESLEVRMLFLDGRDDMAEFASAQPLEAEPGERFEYSSNTSVILADIATRALTDSRDPEIRRRAMADYLQTRLFGPLGMESMVPEFDRAGTLIGGSLIHGTARDWARFAEFLRTKGSHRGAQLVPRAWVEAMVTPSPRAPHYGFQTWLNRDFPRAAGEEHPLFPDSAPPTLFAMIGHMGQYALVSPEQRVTLVRLGHSDAQQRAALLPRMADILALYPAR